MALGPDRRLSASGTKRSRDGDSRERTEKSGDSLTSTLADAPGFSLTLDLEQIKQQQVHNMLEELEKSTHFGKSELEQLHTWVKQNCQGGLVDRTAFAKGLNSIGITDPLMIEQNFSAFDTDKSGTIDFREFAVGLSTVLKGSSDEKITLMFKSYDLDGDGFLSPDEIFYIFKTSMRAQGGNMSDPELRLLVTEVIKSIDQNNDGRIDLNEFTQAIKSNKLAFLFPK